MKNPVFFCSFVRWGAAAFSTWKLVDPQFKLKGFQGGDKKSKKYEQTQMWPGIVETKVLYI